MNYKTYIFDEIQKYIDDDILRFHMPGHYAKDFKEYTALGKNLLKYDVTEIPGMDNLQDSNGVIKKSMEQLAKVFGAKQSFYLVNGSTSGIHIAVDTLLSDGGKVFVARNSHKSVKNIIQKKSAEVKYIYPEIDETFGLDSHIELDGIVKAVEEYGKPDAVVLTYPNYYGRCYDLESIYNYLHSQDIPLIVDSAHGASFGFSEELPKSAVQFSDICIHSLHKTLPALTQVSVLHIGKNFSEQKLETLKKNMEFYLTTSPSYIFMISAEISVKIMQNIGEENLKKIKRYVDSAKKKLKENKIDVYGGEQPQDFCKLLIQTDIAGEKFSEILRKKYKIQCEMTVGNAILFMVGIKHTKKDIEYLANSIIEIVEKNSPKKSESKEKKKNQKENQKLYKKEKNIKTVSKTHSVETETNETINKKSENEKQATEKIKDEIDWKKLNCEEYTIGENQEENQNKKFVYLPKTEIVDNNIKEKLKTVSVVSVPLEKSEGLVSAKDIVPYPPGIPVLLKYEIINEDICKLLVSLGYKTVDVFERSRDFDMR